MGSGPSGTPGKPHPVRNRAVEENTVRQEDGLAQTLSPWVKEENASENPLKLNWVYSAVWIHAHVSNNLIIKALTALVGRLSLSVGR